TRRPRDHALECALSVASLQSIAHELDVEPAADNDGHLRTRPLVSHPRRMEGSRLAAPAFQGERLSDAHDRKNLSRACRWDAKPHPGIRPLGARRRNWSQAR